MATQAGAAADAKAELADAKAAFQRAEAALQRAEAELADAKAELADAKALATGDVAYVGMYTSAQNGYASAQNGYASAQQTVQAATQRLIALTAGSAEKEFQDWVRERFKEVVKLVTPGTVTTGLKDGVTGGQIMQRQDYNFKLESKIFDNFKLVDISHRFKAFRDTILPWKELALKELEEKEASEAAGKAKRKAGPKSSTGSEKKKKLKLEDMPDAEISLQHGVSHVLRRLAKTGSSVNVFHDTSGGGMTGSSAKPDCIFSSVQGLVSWYTAVFVGGLKWDLKNATDRKICVGQLANRFREIIATQKGRKLVFGFIADRNIIQFAALNIKDDGEEEFWWSEEYPFNSEATDDTGFSLLLRMICAQRVLHGYMPAQMRQDIQMLDGRLVTDIQLVNFKADTVSHIDDKGCYVYSGRLDGREVVLKICSKLNHELAMLNTLAGTPGILPVLGSGVSEDGESYMVIPMCSQLSEIDVCSEMLVEVAMTIKLLSDKGIFHSDISAGNIVHNGNRYCLIDFGSAVNYSLNTDDQERTGCTPVFVAIQVMEGKHQCVSSELESLMYVLVYLALKGKVPWKHIGSAEQSVIYKRRVFSDDKLFQEKIVCHMKEEVQPLVWSLRNLFFKPKYQECVTFEAFCGAIV